MTLSQRPETNQRSRIGPPSRRNPRRLASAADGLFSGAISASTPTMRASDAHLTLVREQVVGAVRALSAELGAQAHPHRPSAAAE